MLEALGIEDVDELFRDIPDSIRLNRRLNIQPPLSELEVSKRVKGLARKNISTEDAICFLGAGAYDHYIPSVVGRLVSRSEFYTSYTPYQPEINQGTLQAIFEFQTMIANLTGMDISNASVYDGATATAEAALMAVDRGKGNKIVISQSVHPEVREVVRTYMNAKDIRVVEVGTKDGITDMEELEQEVDRDTLGVILQSPNFFGIIEDVTRGVELAHENKALMIMNVDPISLGILKTPGEYGADIAVGEGQSLGNPLNFADPTWLYGEKASDAARRYPAKRDRMESLTLTLQAREQHIRRKISQYLFQPGIECPTATIYMATMGKRTQGGGSASPKGEVYPRFAGHRSLKRSMTGPS